jgi:hypothetical protein
VVQVVVIALILAVAGVSILSYNLLKPVRSLAAATERKTNADREGTTQIADMAMAVEANTAEVRKNAEAHKAASKAAESGSIIMSSYVSYWEQGYNTLGELNEELKKYGDYLTLTAGVEGTEFLRYSWLKTKDALDEYKAEFDAVIDQAAKYGLQLDFNNDTLDTAIQKIRAIREEYLALTKRIDSMQRSLDDQLRSIRRQGMTDEQKQSDIQRQYYEKIADAQNAANNGNYDMALALYEQAKSLASQLAHEVKNVAGETISTLESNTVKAARLMEAAGKKAIEVLKKMRQQLGFNANPETLALPEFGRGGPIGGRPHSRGGTLIEAERGEFIHPVASVNYYSRQVMEALRRRLVDPVALRRLVFGRGKLSIPAPRFDAGGLINLAPRSAGTYAAEGGMVTDVVELRLSTGDDRAAVRGDRENVEGVLRMLKQFRARARG